MIIFNKRNTNNKSRVYSISFNIRKQGIHFSYKLKKELEMTTEKRVVFLFRDGRFFFRLTENPDEGSRIRMDGEDTDNRHYGIITNNYPFTKMVLAYFKEEYSCRFFVDIKKKKLIDGVEFYKMERVIYENKKPCSKLYLEQRQDYL